MEEVTAQDRAWFEAHPDEEAYVREIAEAEYAMLTNPSPYLSHAVVRQVVPGRRVKEFIGLAVPLDEPLEGIVWTDGVAYPVEPSGAVRGLPESEKVAEVRRVLSRGKRGTDR